MKIFFPAVIVSALVSTSTAKYASPQAAAQPHQYPYVAPSKAQMYGPGPIPNSPYPQQAFNPYGHTEDYVAPTVPDVGSPYPFMEFPKDTEQNKLDLPNLGDYHCFLHGAPWTQCGRRSLTSYFLDQCMTMYYRMASNIDGVCGTASDPATASNGYDYNMKGYQPQQPLYQAPPGYGPPPAQYQQRADTYAAPSTAPKVEQTAAAAHGSGYSRPVSSEYMKEKCYQSSFVSITTATVMCLTENMIRIKYIEHYAADASSNPIEGPQLYLKKMHAFIKEVITCGNSNGRKAAENYPQLYRTFRDGATVTYNPNSPFFLNDQDEVEMKDYTTGESSGMKVFTVGDRFRCSNIEKLSGMTYKTSKTSPFYNYRYANSRSTRRQSKAAEAYKVDDLLRKCDYDNSNEKTSDMSLRSLYDSVHPFADKNSALRRPQTIAEIAVSHAGVLEQPELEGFGIMYFCAFYACKANNGGNLDGTCFPDFNPESDWKYDSSSNKFKDLIKSSEYVKTCATEKYLTRHDINIDEASSDFAERNNERNYICRNENEIVDLLKEVYGRKEWNEDNDAMKWVYGRYLADVKMSTYRKRQCTSTRSLYRNLQDALDSLTVKCDNNKREYAGKLNEHKKKQWEAQQYAQYQAQYAQQQQQQYQQYKKSPSAGKV
jgi:hypothetical protein